VSVVAENKNPARPVPRTARRRPTVGPRKKEACGPCFAAQLNEANPGSRRHKKRLPWELALGPGYSLDWTGRLDYDRFSVSLTHLAAVFMSDPSIGRSSCSESSILLIMCDAARARQRPIWPAHAGRPFS